MKIELLQKTYELASTGSLIFVKTLAIPQKECRVLLQF